MFRRRIFWLGLLCAAVSGAFGNGGVCEVPHYTPPSGLVSHNGSCGRENGYICLAAQCCSPWGWCGSTKDHCGEDCQVGFGLCDEIQTGSGYAATSLSVVETTRATFTLATLFTSSSATRSSKITTSAISVDSQSTNCATSTTAPGGSEVDNGQSSNSLTLSQNSINPTSRSSQSAASPTISTVTSPASEAATYTSTTTQSSSQPPKGSSIAASSDEISTYSSEMSNATPTTRLSSIVSDGPLSTSEGDWSTALPVTSTIPASDSTIKSMTMASSSSVSTSAISYLSTSTSTSVTFTTSTSAKTSISSTYSSTTSAVAISTSSSKSSSAIAATATSTSSAIISSVTTSTNTSTKPLATSSTRSSALSSTSSDIPSSTSSSGTFTTTSATSPTTTSSSSTITTSSTTSTTTSTSSLAPSTITTSTSSSRTSSTTSFSTTTSTTSITTSASTTVLNGITYAWNPTPTSTYIAPPLSAFSAVPLKNDVILEKLGQPFTSYTKDGRDALPYFGTIIDGHQILYDFSEPGMMQFCDLDDAICYSFRDNSLHIFPADGGEAIASISPSVLPRDAFSTGQTAHLGKRAIDNIIVDPPFDAIAAFVDNCNTDLDTLNPLPEFFFDGVPCVDPKYIQDNIYQATCKFVLAEELACRDNVKSVIDDTIGGKSLVKKLQTLWENLGGESTLGPLALTLEAYFGAFKTAALLQKAAPIAGRAFGWYALIYTLLIDIIGSENLAEGICVGYMSVCCLDDTLSLHDVTVKAHGMTFTLASINRIPELGFVFAADKKPFKITSLSSPACGPPAGELIHNGGFEDDGAMAPFPNGMGWWVPVAPTDPQEFARFRGWQVTTGTDPPAVIKTTGCLKGARCLQMYALDVFGKNGGATRVYQGLAGLKMHTTYSFSFSYRIDFLSVLSGTLDAVSNYCYLFSSFHDSDNGQPGFMRFTAPVAPGAGQWQTVTRQFTAYRGWDVNAQGGDEFQIIVACNAPSADVQFGITIDELSAVPV